MEYHCPCVGLHVAAENKVLIVQLGGLTPLIRQMLSPNVEVQCNAVGCITNLATHEENKAKIARSGALGPLTRLAKSRDMRVQRNATGALLNMTHSGTLANIAFDNGWLTAPTQMRTGNSSLTPAPFRFLFSFYLPQMSTSSTTAQPLSAISLWILATEESWHLPSQNWFSLWSTSWIHPPPRFNVRPLSPFVISLPTRNISSTSYAQTASILCFACFNRPTCR